MWKVNIVGLFFLPSKVLNGVPVLNRYYGVFEDGRIKMRGIEARRQDTPNLIRGVQIRMIKTLAKASNREDFLAKVPEALDVLRDYAEKLVSRQVNVQELTITKQLSKRLSGIDMTFFRLSLQSSL